jgi:hypothetical protein
MSNTKNKNQLVTVVIPIYRNSLSDIEQWAVARNLKVLSQERDIAIVCPDNLNLSTLDELFDITNGRYRIERFSPEFFNGRQGYNRFMLSRELYSRFTESQFVLICQTDVALFHDKLDYWCSLDYDYIGAPWLPAKSEIAGWNLIKRAVYQFRRGWARLKGGFSPVNLKWKVGNGGFSLRRVETMLKVLDEHPTEMAEIAKESNKIENFEDVVWSVRVNELWPGSVRIPDASTAAHFAIEGHPETAMLLTNGELPMGTHAFYRRRNRSFWSKYMDFDSKTL